MERKRDAPMQRDLAYESLRQALQLGRIPGGQRLREPEWSRRLGVNRAALREALARLLAEGLVVEGQKGGYFVPTLSPEDVREIGELRLMLELAAVNQILKEQRNSAEDLCELRVLCDDQEWMLQRGYTADPAEAEQLFHEKIVWLSGNRRLCLLYRALPQPPRPLACVEVMRETRSSRQMLAQHRAILAGLEKGQFSLVRKTLQDHYRLTPTA